MKKMFTRLLLTFFVVLGISACGPSSCTQNGEGSGQDTEVVMKAYSAVFTRAQIDSLCSADGLSNNFDDWMTTTFVDYESSERVTKFVWVNSISDDEEITYIVVPKDTLYNFTKRVIISEEIEEEE